MTAAPDGWHPVAAHDCYHGKIYGLDGRAAWVVPVRHVRSGWAVEVRDGDPDGPLVQRSWHPHRQAAGEVVDALRSRLALSTIDDVVTGAVPPPPPRGVLAVHGIRHERHAIFFGSAGSGPAGYVCLRVWVPRGTPRCGGCSRAASSTNPSASPASCPCTSRRGRSPTSVCSAARPFRPRLCGDAPPRLHGRCGASSCDGERDAAAGRAD
jgi:hypothetical protein